MVELDQTCSANKRTIITDNEQTCLMLIKVKRSEKKTKVRKEEHKDSGLC